jgi:hypothetical protein
LRFVFSTRQQLEEMSSAGKYVRKTGASHGVGEWPHSRQRMGTAEALTNPAAHVPIEAA